MGGPVKRPTGSWRVEPLASLRADWTGLDWSWILLSKKNCNGRIGTTERLAPGRLDSCARTQWRTQNTIEGGADLFFFLFSLHFSSFLHLFFSLTLPIPPLLHQL
jgi:hypothetical protein